MKHADLNALVALDALLEHASVTRAAEQAHVSKPAMSQSLSRLRARIGDPLLVRTGAHLTRTPHAERLRPRVRQIVEDAFAVLARAGDADVGDLERTFRIHATDQALAVLGTALDRLARRAPAVTLHFQPAQSQDAALLRDGQVDLAIGVYEDPPYSELPGGLRIQKLYTDRFVCVVRRGHPRVGGRLDLARFVKLDHIQITPRGRPGGYVDDMLALHGLRRRIVRAVPYFLAGLLLVASSDQVLTISERLARPLARKLGLRILAPPPELGLEPYTTAQIWHPRSDPDAGHRWLRESVREAARRSAGRT